MIDSFGREINYARISLTDKCNLRCVYCMPEEGLPPKDHGDLLSFEEMEAVADALLDLGITKIRITGGEPLVRRGALDLIKKLGAKEKLKQLSMTTNGVLLKEYAKNLFDAGVRGLNISLDTVNTDLYKKITRRGDLGTVLDGIAAAKDAGFEKIKLNAVLLKGMNDGDAENLIDFAAKNGLLLRFIELMPFCCQSGFAKENFMPVDEIIARHPKWTYLGNDDHSTAEYYMTEKGARVGFIRPLTRKFCGSCNRIRVTSEGVLLTCLHSSKGYNLKPYLCGGLKDYIAECVKQKPRTHCLENGASQIRDMNEIGG